MITVEQTGPLALLQDLGRPGLAHLGVTASVRPTGPPRLAIGWSATPSAVAVEVALGGLVISTDRPLWCVVTGAPTRLQVDDRPQSSHHSLALRAGQRLRIDAPPRGLRNYLAVRGGFDVGRVLGSASTDVLAGLGPEPLAVGVRLAVGSPTDTLPETSFAPPAELVTDLRITPGPRRDWFTDDAWHRLTTEPWEVSTESDRIGIRLRGRQLDRRIGDELPSEALLPGAVQVPASGQPLIFGPDHPVTGGYPVIAVLTEDARDAAGQLRGGDVIRLVPR